MPLPPREPSLRIVASVSDAQATVGGSVTVILRISNVGGAPVDRINILSTGDWDKYAELRLEPEGAIEHTEQGLWLRSPLPVPPGDTTQLVVTGRVLAEGRHRFAFAAYRFRG